MNKNVVLLTEISASHASYNSAQVCPLSRVQMHWICPLYKLSTCWVFVDVLSSGVFKWPQQWLNMMSIPKISQRLMLNHSWESEVYSSLRTRKCLVALPVSELIDEYKKAKKKRRGKTKAWTRRRSSKGCYNNIVKELMIEDTAGYKEMMRVNHGNFWICWALRVRGLNTLSVAVQMHSALLSHTWMTAKQRKCWAVLSEKFDQFQIWLKKSQHRSTPLNRMFKCAQLVALNMLRACTVDKSSAFARGFITGEVDENHGLFLNSWSICTNSGSQKSIRLSIIITILCRNEIEKSA